MPASPPGAEQLLEQLVSVNSINPGFPGIARETVIGGETACTRLIGAYLSNLGFELHDIAVDPQRINLAAVLKGAGGGRSLLFNGHVDTVAPFKPEAWTSGDPWKPVRRGEELFALGSTDMKGGLAAACLAIAALKEAGVLLKGDLQVHAVVGEETMDHENGTTAVIKAGFRADAAIVAEPSSQPERLTIAPVSAGNFNLEISVKGHGTHAGNRGAAIRAGGEGPSAGVNAVEKLIKIVQALQDLEQEWGYHQTPSGLSARAVFARAGRIPRRCRRSERRLHGRPRLCRLPRLVRAARRPRGGEGRNRAPCAPRGSARPLASR
ncbi:M20/M25/M40 family metallo-hydrolase [Sinorhizobium meliloti]|nr:M20/M25/M40 family metallo-hydrolase [Sinorhizobium meliloti]